MLRDDISQVWNKSKQDLIFTQATALAYTTLVSLVPVLPWPFSYFMPLVGLKIYSSV